MANQCGDRAAVVATLRGRQLVRGDPDGTEERSGLAAQMLQIGREVSDPEDQMWAHLWRIDVRFQRGDLAGIGRELHHLAWCVGEMGAPAGAGDFPTFGAIYSLFPTYVLISAGRRAEAAGLYRALGPVAEWQPIQHAVTPVYALGIVVAAATGDAEDLGALRGLLGQYRGDHVASGAGVVAYGGPVELYLGIAARHLGLLDDAVAELDQARQARAANGAARFHVEALVELAVALGRRAGHGDTARARSLSTDVARRATTLGMAPFAARAQQLADQLGRAPAELLTPREREVAELVALGLTNREIAARLYLSERTAQNHVQHILTKLDLPNRSQIAVWITSRS